MNNERDKKFGIGIVEKHREVIRESKEEADEEERICMEKEVGRVSKHEQRKIDVKWTGYKVTSNYSKREKRNTVKEERKTM